jgi:glycosyltransferase involved in cell wall biosynthesis
MKILLVQSTVYVPSWGGANKSNRLLLEGLTDRGHNCRVVAPACGAHACASREAFLSALSNRGIVSTTLIGDIQTFEFNRVEVRAVVKPPGMVTSLIHEIRDFAPDWVIVASEDPGQVLLAIALKEAPSRIVYLARTTLTLPFGPGSPFHSSSATNLLRQVAGIVCVSRYLVDYFRQWAGLESTELPICPNGPGPFPELGRLDRGHVTMVNPCAYKGLSLFAALAKAVPKVSFAAVPTWGTTDDDIRQLSNIPNVTLLGASDDIDDVFASTRVLLVPSLWAEAKSNMITEAMLRGIPVLASDVGGNGEALLGIEYLLPVNPIGAYQPQLDQRMLPVSLVPPQDIRPWLDALGELLGSHSSYRRVSAAARAAALAANEKNTVVPFEDYLMQLSRIHSRFGAA